LAKKGDGATPKVTLCQVNDGLGGGFRQTGLDGQETGLYQLTSVSAETAVVPHFDGQALELSLMKGQDSLMILSNWSYPHAALRLGFEYCKGMQVPMYVRGRGSGASRQPQLLGGHRDAGRAQRPLPHLPQKGPEVQKEQGAGEERGGGLLHGAAARTQSKWAARDSSGRDAHEPPRGFNRGLLARQRVQKVLGKEFEEDTAQKELLLDDQLHFTLT
jgi:hypothetical protein